jgi:hypothetical protein
MSLSAIGLALDFLGVVLITAHMLYDFGIDFGQSIFQNPLKNESTDEIRKKLLSGQRLTSAEKEILVELIKENIALGAFARLLGFWLWINQNIFRFTPWIEERPRLVNKFLWNLLGGLLLVIGFFLQFLGTFIK